MYIYIYIYIYIYTRPFLPWPQPQPLGRPRHRLRRSSPRAHWPGARTWPPTPCCSASAGGSSAGSGGGPAAAAGSAAVEARSFPGRSGGFATAAAAAVICVQFVTAFSEFRSVLPSRHPHRHSFVFPVCIRALRSPARRGFCYKTRVSNDSKCARILFVR